MADLGLAGTAWPEHDTTALRARTDSCPPSSGAGDDLRTLSDPGHEGESDTIIDVGGRSRRGH
jgi:hypothetical protein